MADEKIETESEKLEFLKKIFPTIDDEVVIDALASNGWNVEIGVQVLLTISENHICSSDTANEHAALQNTPGTSGVLAVASSTSAKLALNIPFGEPSVQPVLSVSSPRVGPKGKRSKNATNSPRSRQPEVRFTPGPSFELGLKFIETHPKALILMRGVPGSGKSTLAKKLAEWHDGVCYSSDDFHYDQNGVYCFDPANLSKAHGNNQRRAEFAMEAGISPVLIDNTNLELWETKPYAVSACKNGYDIAVLEPDTPWRYDPRICGQKNTHGVPRQKISQMIEKLKRNPITASQVKAYGQSFLPNLNPRNLESVPPTPSNHIPGISLLPKISATAGSKSESSQFDRISLIQLPGDAGDDRQNIPEATEISKAQALPQRKRFDQPSRIVGSYDLNERKPSVFQSQPEDSNGDLEATRSLEPTAVSVTNLEEKVHNVLARKDTGSSDQSSDADYSFTSPDDTGKPNEPRTRRRCKIAARFSFGETTKSLLQDLTTSSVASSNVGTLESPSLDVFPVTSAVTTEALRTEGLTVCPETVPDMGIAPSSIPPVVGQEKKGDMTSTPPKVSNMRTNSVGAMDHSFLQATGSSFSLDWRGLDVIPNVETQMCSSANLQSDLNTSKAVYKDVGVQANYSDNSCIGRLKAQAREISAGLPELKCRPNATRSMLDKGTSIDESEFESNSSVKMLIKMFPTASVDALKDVLKNCGDDLDWAVNVLLDSNYEMESLVEGDVSESEDEVEEEVIVENREEKNGVSETVSLMTDVAVGSASRNDFEGAITDDVKRNELEPAPLYNNRDQKKLKNMIEDLFVMSPAVSDHARRLTGKDYSGFRAYDIRCRRGLETPRAASATPTDSPVPPYDNKQLSLPSTSFQPPSDVLPGDADFESVAATDLQQDEEMVPMIMSPDFANRLIKMFVHPNEAKDGDRGLKPDHLKTLIPRSLAMEIYSYWCMSLFCSEQDTKDNGKQSTVPVESIGTGSHLRRESNLQEIMDMELALKITEDEMNNSEEIRTLKKSIAFKLTEKLLHENFPQVDSTYLDAVFEAHSYNYENTVKILEELLEVSARRPAQNSAPVQSSSQPQQPVENVAEDLASPSMDWKDARERAQQHVLKRQEYLALADESFRKGMSAVASYYTREARFHYDSAKDYNAIAMELLSDHAEVQEGDTYTLDLHCLYVPEALKLLDRSLKEKGYLNRSKGGCIHVITGRGLRSINGVSRIKPAVQAYLKQKRMRFEELNPGMLKVHLR